MSIRQKKLTIEALERIDDLCADFEQRWIANDPPSIESLLAPDIPANQRDALLAELILLDLDYRRRRGETPSKQEYMDRFPDQAQAIHDAWNDGGKPTGAFVPPSVQQMADLLPSLQIMELIGAGGMGAVYKARQEGLDRIVAVKILPQEFGHDVKFALRFTREARTLAKLNHPNIVALYEFGNVADTYYFLMEYVEGSTLRDLVKGGQLAPQHALAIVPHLCDALQYAHDKGVVHRDIKPENILMSVDGNVKIADFGLSRILGNETQQQSLTATHQIMGTPRYMAPEQMEGTHNVDHRADIYSLGVVIYEMLTGELPIGRFAAPSTKVQIDVRLDDVVMRTLEKEPQRRYQRASEIKSDVQSITSTVNPAYAETQVAGTPRDPERTRPVSVEQQELAGRFLITRRELMDRVKRSLRPLLGKQIIQILIGVAIIILGAQCWARNTHVPHRLFSGIILHVYGVFLIGSAVAICTRIKQIDYSKPVGEIRDNLGRLQSVYLGVGPVIGFPWWLLWIPVCVAIGFDQVMHPNSLIASLVVGAVGLAASIWLYWRAVRSGNAASESWKMKLSGGSIAAAYLALDEIENAQIR
ncbi:Serine/threonine-protein kinase PknB [Rubripirellula lacrimiformis]|uniref:Serine/threonine-protein kinase PknB n=1 Tax=Rubripirellula lacrimiformis TaxID=1930273 RepID=A0A517NEW7_9BACT|nr:serine/threonine-protein kinase [Rubripirellula lacrimiformis]QDT05665.1 Serine/threonine-protein kinase PknB [Rubripirellula lacrimiformis]